MWRCQSMDANVRELKALEEELELSKKRYDIVMKLSDVTTFDYNVVTKKIITQHEDFEEFGMPPVMEDGVEDVIKSGIVTGRSVNDIRNLYKRIDEGAPFAKTVVYAYDRSGTERMLEIVLVNVFNEKGQPVYAVGARKDITDSRILKREESYKNIADANKILIYDANVTTDRYTSYNKAFFTKFGIPQSGSVSETLDYMCNEKIASKHKDKAFNTLSNTAVIDAYNKGKLVVSCQNLILMPTNEFEWYEETLHIIKDELTGDIHARCYIKNINEEKEREREDFEERRHYETIVSKLSAVYEFNITRKKAVRGFDDWKSLYGVDIIDDYTQIMTDFAKVAVHPEDRVKFHNLYNTDVLLREYAQGKQDVEGEYRWMDSQGKYIWVVSTIHLFQEPLGGDIMGFSYVKSIDYEKKEQINLRYRAERDSLTDFYNKSTLEEKISLYFDTEDAKSSTHAFLMLDLDNFKAINDNFGHAFGDAFLSQMALKIRELFRADDFLGRVGGDEFVVLMKHIPNERMVSIKASEICRRLAETYIKDSIEYHVSVSIGIAIYREHGQTYSELYRHADTALYYAKEQGRNQYVLYDNSMQGGATNIKAIDVGRTIEAKKIEGNISEYIFRILYESIGSATAIQTVLELIGKHYASSRVYVFEKSTDGLSMKNTFEWCAEGISPQIQRLQRSTYLASEEYKKNFNSESYFYMNDIEKANPKLKERLKPQGIKSMLQFAIEKKGNLIGIIGFDQCDHLREPKQEELSQCRNMSNVIGIFLNQMRTMAKIESDAENQMARSIINGLGSITYVCDPKTYKVLFISKRLHELAPDAKVGDICYQAFWANDKPCKDCPMKALSESKNTRCVAEMFNTNLSMWVKATTSWIDWTNEEQVCLVNSLDITKYITKKEPI